MQKELWKIPDDWFVRWFNTPVYHRLYGPRNQEEADAFVDCLAEEVIALPPGQRLLECACGAGRHAIRFAQRGIPVHGMDLAANSIAEARKKGSGYPDDLLSFSTGDMRNLSDVMSHGPYGAITLLFTSFGYFATDAEHFQTLENFHEALHPGGIFVLDFLNVALLRNTLVPHEIVDRDGTSFEIWRRINDGWIEKAIRFDDEQGRPQLHHERVRAFDSDALSRMLTGIGFHLQKIAGDYKLGPHSATSPRCILICQKQ